MYGRPPGASTPHRHLFARPARLTPPPAHASVPAPEPTDRAPRPYRMMPFRRTAAPHLALLAVLLAPCAAAAQPVDAWVLPRGLLELDARAHYTHFERRLGWGDPALGAELVPAYQAAADRVLGEPAGLARAGVAGVLGSLPGGDPSVADALTGGRVALGLATDARVLPVALRYGLTRRITVFAELPLERRETSPTGLYLAGANLGVNPAPDSNRAALARINPAYADFGAGALLPVAGTPAALELQARLRAASPGDTLRLPAFPVRFANLLGTDAPLTAEERAAFALGRDRRPFAPGDLQVGARLLLLGGPGPGPGAEVAGRGVRAMLAVRGRLPTGRGGVTFLTELPAEGGHAGVGADLAAELFSARRWSVHGGASLDHRFAADVVTLAFGQDRPFPGDTALRTMRRTPGLELRAALAPRWRLTEEIAFEGSYALLARAQTELLLPEGVLPAPLEWHTGGSAHAFGAGMRYSTFRAFAAGRTGVPFEVTLSLATTVAGAGLAPDATTVRLGGRILADPRHARALLPGREPPPPPADTLPAAPVPPDTVSADTLPARR